MGYSLDYTEIKQKYQMMYSIICQLYPFLQRFGNLAQPCKHILLFCIDANKAERQQE